MKGVILDFNIKENKGFISGDDNQRYHFVGAEWMEQNNPITGQRVDFEVGEASGEAKSVFLEVKAKPSLNRATTQQGIVIESEEDQYNMFDWFAKCIKNYTNFNGRARRKEFWFYMLTVYVVGILANIIDAMIGVPIFSAIWSLFTFLPTLAVSARRLHDVNMTGWWYLLVFTIIGIIPLIIWWATDTKPDENRWGLPARELD